MQRRNGAKVQRCKGLSFSERIERCDSVCRLNSFHFPQFFGRLIWNDDGAVLLTYQDCGEEDHERGPPPLPDPYEFSSEGLSDWCESYPSQTPEPLNLCVTPLMTKLPVTIAPFGLR